MNQTNLKSIDEAYTVKNEEDISLAYIWCKEILGEQNNRWSFNAVSKEFYFKLKKDADLFTVIW